MKWRTKSLLWIITACMLSLVALFYLDTPKTEHQPDLTHQEIQWLKGHSNVIRVAPLPDSPPVDFINKSGLHLGLTSDYFRLIEQKLNIRFVQVNCDSWKDVLAKLRNKEIDMVGSIQNTDERRQFLRFTEPYLKLPNVILTRTEWNETFSLNNLQDLSLAVVEGSAAYDYIRDMYPEYTLIPLKDAATGVRMVSFKEADAMVADLGVASYYIEELGINNLRVAGNINYPWELCIASRKDWPLLNSILNKTLASIAPDQRRLIMKEWITLSDTLHIPRDRYLKIIGGFLIVTLLSISSVMFWNHTLRKQISHRTRELGRVQQSHALATRALDESEERFRILVESSNDIIWEIDKLGNYSYVSSHVYDILGYYPDELVGTHSCSLMVPHDSARNTEAFRQYTITTTIDCEVNTYLHKKGHRVMLESNGKAFKNNTGDLAGFRGVSRDITERVANENALRQSEERFRNLVETSSDWIWEVGTDGIYQYASPQVSSLLGYSADELLGKHFTNLMPPAEAKGIQSLFSKVLKQGSSIQSLVNTNRHKDGRTVVLETSAVPFYNKDRNIQGYRGIGRDITKRICAEKQLEFERNLFRSFMEHAPDLIYFKDAEGRFIEVNDAKANELGLSPEDLIGRTDFDFMPKDQAQQKLNDELEIMRSRKPIQKEEFTTTPNGNRWYLTTKVPRYDEEGEVIGTFGTSWDITNRKFAQEELRQLRALLSNTINSMPSILIGVDAEGVVIQWNRQAESTTGLLSKDAIGQPLREISPLLNKEMVKVERAIRERAVQKKERIPIVENNRTRYKDITVFPLLEGNIDGAVIRVDDVTDRVRIEDMMVQSEKMMSVGGLAAGMAHEINNPLAGILQNTQVMQNRIMHKTERNTNAATEAGTSLEAIQTYMEDRGLIQMMDSISEAGRRAAKIVDNMLSFSRKDEADFAPNNLQEIIERSIDLASNDYNLKKRFDFRHIKIVREIEPLDLIPCEGSQIQQVILNLLSNSAQAMAEYSEKAPKPQITVRLKADKDMAILEVEDNGPGMDEETKKRAFEPFFTTKDVGRGTGLGLSVSYFIITENHGGFMNLTSTLGKGACFTIRIPLVHRTARWGLRL